MKSKVFPILLFIAIVLMFFISYVLDNRPSREQEIELDGFAYGITTEGDFMEHFVNGGYYDINEEYLGKCTLYVEERKHEGEVFYKINKADIEGNSFWLPEDLEEKESWDELGYLSIITESTPYSQYDWIEVYQYEKDFSPIYDYFE